MKRRRLIATLLAMPALLAPAAVRAQGAAQSAELLLQAGGMTYAGDLNNQRLLSTPHPAFGLGVRNRLDNRWAVRLGAAVGSVSGGEPDCITRRNLSFHSVIVEATAGVEFNFWSYGAGATDRPWVFYLYADAGLFFFNPRATVALDDGTTVTVDLQPLHTEGQGSDAYPDRKSYSRLQLCLPFGVGVKWQVNKSLSIGVEYGLRYTWTDYLDDVSTTYVDPEVLRQGAREGDLAVRLADRSAEVEPGYVNAPGIKRGDDSLNDLYTSFSLSIGISLESLFGWTHKNRCRMNN